MAKRWQVKWDETEIPDGEYVRAADYDALVALCDDVFAWNDWAEFAAWKARFDALKATADREGEP